MRPVVKLSMSAAVAAFVVMFALPPVKAYADITWTLSDVTFSDSAMASGSFVTDDTGALETYDIATGWGTLPAETYSSSEGSTVIYSFTGGTGLGFTVVSDDGTQTLSLGLLGDLPDGATTLEINTSSYEEPSDIYTLGYRSVISGEADGLPTSDVPEPMSITLLGAGLISLVIGRGLHRNLLGGLSRGTPG